MVYLLRGLPSGCLLDEITSIYMILLWCSASSSASPARLHVSLWSAGWRTACLPACCLGLTISSPPKAGSQYLSLSPSWSVYVCVCMCVCASISLSLSLSENLLIREDCSNAANQSPPPPLLNSTLQLLKGHTLCTDASFLFSLPPSPVAFYHSLTLCLLLPHLVSVSAGWLDPSV